MKRRTLVLLTFLLVAMSVFSQRVRFNLSFNATAPADLSKVYVQPLNAGAETKAQALRLKEGVYTGNVPVSTSGFYELVLVINNGQWMTTVYSTEGKSVELAVEFDGASVMERSNNDNSALSLLNSLISGSNRKLWVVKDMPDNELKALVENCSIVSDSIIKAAKPSFAVAEYMKALSYTAAQNIYSLIPRAQGRRLQELSFTKDDVIPSGCKGLLDNEYAILIPSVKQQIFAAVSADASVKLDGMLKLLYDGYSCGAVRAKVADMLLERFLSQHDYANDFDGGYEYIQKVVKDYGLSSHYADEYMKHKSVIVGADFPESVVLVDSKGQKVDFSTFKGKYVYIDVWASWCAPCCKEVPYLQALEKEMEGGDVVFVSVSTDTDVEAWKAKMVALNMHGNQLLDRDNELCKRLNVGGIPFFVIYDKEGKLHTYGAMRPSTGNSLKQFLQNLP